jgi:CCDC81-like prokaryotic HU domain 2/CCDC81-like prokaryotic HU domain 1
MTVVSVQINASTFAHNSLAPVMTIDIPLILFRLLHRHECVGVQGLGDFRTTPRSAVVDHVQGLIYPPNKILTFEENPATTGDILTQSIKQAYNIDGYTAQQAVNYYVAQIQEALSRREFVAIPSVGRICRNHDNKIQFFTDNNNFSTAVYGLPAVQYYPILRNEEAKPLPQVASEVAAPLPLFSEPALQRNMSAAVVGGMSQGAPQMMPPPPTMSPPESARNTFFSDINWGKIVPIAAGVLGCIALAMFVSRTMAANKAQTIASNNDPVKASPISHIDSSNLYRADSLASAYSTTKKGDDFKAYPDEARKVGDAFSSARAVKNKTTSSSEASILDAAIFDSNIRARSNKKKIVNVAPAKQRTSGGRGVMIIGSFKEGDNVQKLLAKIHTLGFEPYKYEIGNGLVRMGVKMPTYSNDLEKTSKMQEIKAFFGANAWLKE